MIRKLIERCQFQLNQSHSKTDIKNRSKIKLAGGVLLLSTLLWGCQNVDPYTGEVDPNRSTKKSGLIYSIYSTSSVGWNHKKKAATNLGQKEFATKPCLSDGDINWNYLSTIEQELNNHHSTRGMDVFRYGPRIYIRLPGDEIYLVDSPHFNPEFYPQLNELIVMLKKYENMGVELIGHADSTGTTDYNQRLSELRAYNLERYLNKYGLSPASTQSYGRGEMEPLANNSTVHGRSINRRVTMILCQST